MFLLDFGKHTNGELSIVQNALSKSGHGRAERRGVCQTYQHKQKFRNKKTFGGV